MSDEPLSSFDTWLRSVQNLSPTTDYIGHDAAKVILYMWEHSLEYHALVKVMNIKESEEE